MSLNKKARYWLEMCSFGAGSGMYPGIQADLLPRKIASLLEGDGLIRLMIPHNASHKERWVATDAGRSALTSAYREGE